MRLRLVTPPREKFGNSPKIVSIPASHFSRRNFGAPASASDQSKLRWQLWFKSDGGYPVEIEIRVVIGHLEPSEKSTSPHKPLSLPACQQQGLFQWNGIVGMSLKWPLEGTMVFHPLPFCKHIWLYGDNYIKYVMWVRHSYRTTVPNRSDREPALSK
jgi:hypothetical protein